MPVDPRYQQILVGGPGFIQEALPSGQIITAPTVGPPIAPWGVPSEALPYQAAPQLRLGGINPFLTAAALLGGGALISGTVGAALTGLGAKTLAGAIGVGDAGGGNGMTMEQYGIRGPGVPEPAPGTVKRQWSVAVHSNTYGTFRIFFFQMFDGYTLCYNPSTKSWKRWRPKKVIAFTRGNISLSKAVKIQGILDKLWRKAAKKTKAIKMA